MAQLTPNRVKITKIFFDEIRSLIVSARNTVARGVDLVQVHTNFEIGRRIITQEQKGESRAAYGEEVLKALSEQLKREFGDGFSRRNLELMRRFFLIYANRQKAIAQTLSAQLPILQSVNGKLGTSAQNELRPFALSWSHYVVLLGIKNSDERSFYEIESTAQNWTVRELKRQFDSSLYERLALSRNKKGVRKLAEEGQLITKPQDLLKEPLVLEFLGLDEKCSYSESDLESAIISKIEHFLLELGKGFLFESRQRRFTFDDEHFFVDLVFYNRLLRCYVIVDLKLGKLTHQDLGQMQMYVNYFDRFVKTKAENSTIGIVLCKKKKDALVKITLPKNSNIHAKEYRLYLPSKNELQQKLMEWSGKNELGE